MSLAVAVRSKVELSQWKSLASWVILIESLVTDTLFPLFLMRYPEGKFTELEMQILRIFHHNTRLVRSHGICEKLRKSF